MGGSNSSRKAPSQLIYYSKISNVWHFYPVHCSESTLWNLVTNCMLEEKPWGGRGGRKNINSPSLSCFKKEEKKEHKRDMAGWNHGYFLSMESQSGQVFSLWYNPGKRPPFPSFPAKSRYETKPRHPHVPYGDLYIQHGLQHRRFAKEIVGFDMCCSLKKGVSNSFFRNKSHSWHSETYI